MMDVMEKRVAEVDAYVQDVRLKTLSCGLSYVRKHVNDFDILEAEGGLICSDLLSGDYLFFIKIKDVYEDSAVLKISDLKKENYILMIVRFEFG